MAITASTLTTIVVFLPLAFAQGITGKLTAGLALAVVFSLVSSLFIALTLVPMLGSVLFRRKKDDAAAMRKTIGRDFSRPQAVYRKGLDWALHHRKTVVFGTLGLFAAAIALVPVLGTEFMPSMDMDMMIFKLRAPVGTALAETDRIGAMVEKSSPPSPRSRSSASRPAARPRTTPGTRASAALPRARTRPSSSSGCARSGSARSATSKSRSASAASCPSSRTSRSRPWT